MSPAAEDIITLPPTLADGFNDTCSMTGATSAEDALDVAFEIESDSWLQFLYFSC